MLEQEILLKLMMNDEAMKWTIEMAQSNVPYVREMTIKYLDEVPLSKYFEFCETSGMEANHVETNEDLIELVKEHSMTEVMYIASVSLIALLDEYHKIESDILEMMTIE